MESNYQIKSSVRAKHIRITVFPNGRVVGTKPRRVPIVAVEFFVRRKWPWIISKLEFYKNKPKITLDSSALNKDETLRFVKARIDFFNQHYKFEFSKISIKNHKNLWGSCSSKKNLNFNITISKLPTDQADYIIVHELCHLKELNHSKEFWALVAETIPDYKRIKRELRNYSFA